MTYIDASNTTVGRLASTVAKRLLDGETVIILNAEKAIINGNKEEIIRRYRQKVEVGGMKRKGPYVSRLPHLLLKRTIRGMLPYQQPKGRVAYKKLKVYMGIPEEYTQQELEKINIKRSLKFITLKELSEYLGVKWQQ